MIHIGQPITWSTPAAPRLFAGKCTSYRYGDGVTRQLFDDELGDNVAAALHSRKAEINFAAEVTSASTNFLNLASGPVITVSGISGGVICASRASETWRLQQRKTASVQATHYPDMAASSPPLAGVDLSAFTPSQSGLSIVEPAGVIIYGTYGLTHTEGIVHELTLEQQWTLQEDEPSPSGTILGLAPVGYLRTLRLSLLATGTKPAVKSTLTITGAPAHAADYRIERSEEAFADKRGKMFEITAFWIPPFIA